MAVSIDVADSEDGKDSRKHIGGSLKDASAEIHHDVDGAGTGRARVGEHQVKLAIAVEIGGGEVGGRHAGCNVDGRAEAAIAIAFEERESSGRTTTHDRDIGFAVAIEVPR